MKNIIFTIAIIFFSFSCYSQSNTHTKEHSSFFKPHRISLMWGNTIVPAGKTAHDDESSIILPTWGLNYEYWFNRKWAIGWQNEIELQSYVVEHHSEMVFEREYPYITALVLIFEPIHNLAVHVGPGYEIEENENFFIVKAGMDYVFNLPNDFDISVGFSYDNKRNLYDAWTFGIFLGKRFGPENHK